MTLLTVLSLSKKKDSQFILKEISFTQNQFQKIAIAGETGSGKTTLLKIIAGLVQPDEGVVLLEDERILGPEEKLIAGHPAIAYLSQQFELRNAYRVEELLEYANRLAGQEAQALFEVCRIGHLLKRRTDQLSGGEKQRIAIARLLISSPRLLLLDEPYSNLDMIHKNILKSVIRDIGERLRITSIMVSHSPLDTLSWADEIIIMKEGEIIQKGSPAQIYRQPVNEYAAGLFGKYNLVDAVHAGVLNDVTGDLVREKKLFIRPEDFRIVLAGNGAISGRVIDILFFGSYYEVELLLSGDSMITIKTGEGNFEKGEIVYVSPVEGRAWFM